MNLFINEYTFVMQVPTISDICTAQVTIATQFNLFIAIYLTDLQIGLSVARSIKGFLRKSMGL